MTTFVYRGRNQNKSDKTGDFIKVMEEMVRYTDAALAKAIESEREFRSILDRT